MLYENENEQKNYELSSESTSNQTEENYRYSLNFENGQSIFDLPASSDSLSNSNKLKGLIIETTNMAKTPQREMVPRFLSQISVCKTLETLTKQENDDSNIGQISQQTTHTNLNNNNNIEDPLLAFNDTLLNDFFHTNTLIESDSHNFQSYEIQSDLFEQTQNIDSQITIQPAVSNSHNDNGNISNQLNLLSDQFIFEDQFLKEFEANLDKFESAEFIQNINNGGLKKKT